MFARTPRLTLRPAWPEDAPALATAIAHESVVSMLSRVPWPYAESHAAEFIAHVSQSSDLFALVLAHRRPVARLVGGVGLHAAGDELELGYWFTPSAWGRGYATEAASAMVDVARDALSRRRLVSGCFVDNPASGRVLAKLGFRAMGEEMRVCVARGYPVACTLMTLDLAD